MKATLLRNLIFGSLLLAAILTISGCATTEGDNMSSRPWGYRSGYDPGLPGMMNEGK
jgi:hypothetical protein